MEVILLLKWLHILGACVLIGTGAGIAFFMLMAHRTGDARIIAHTSGIVVLADWIFTASAVILQPLTGLALVVLNGWSMTETWIVLSIALYLGIGAFWVPVVVMQKRLQTFAVRALADNAPLPEAYHALFKRWFFCGIPAFTFILILLWLMVAKPTL